MKTKKIFSKRFLHKYFDHIRKMEMRDLLIALAVTVMLVSISLAAGQGQWPNTSSPSAVQLMNGGWESRGVRTSDGNYIIGMIANNVGLQKLNSAGSKLWNGGDPIDIPDSYAVNEIVADSSGGAFVLYEGTSIGSSNKYIRHVDGSGNELWTVGPFDSTEDSENSPRILNDGNGGLYLAWYRSDMSGYITHLGADGDVCDVATCGYSWNPGGPGTYREKAFPTTGSVSPEPKLILSDSGSVIVSYMVDAGIDVTKFNADSSFAWSLPASYQSIIDQNYLMMAESDGNNGINIAYWNNEGENTNLMMSRVLSTGAFSFAPNSLTIKTIDNTALYTGSMASSSDSSGNMYLAWQQADVATDETDTYVQKINASGVEQWTSGGVLMGTLGDGISDYIENSYLYNLPHTIVADGTGGAIVAMNRNQNMVGGMVVGQRVLNNGNLDWGIGYSLTNNPFVDSDDMPDIISNGSGGALFSWHQWTNSGEFVSAQLVQSAALGLNVTEVLDSSVPTRGGQIVNIKGSGFISGATVDIGGSAATDIIVLADNVLLATVPGHAMGLADVSVTIPGPSSYILNNGVNYINPTPALNYCSGGFSKIDYDSGHGIALAMDGSVWTWGSNINGQLGDGTTTDRQAPVKISGLTDVIDVKVNYNTSYVLKSDGTVWAWGKNTSGEIGDGTYTDRHAPVQITSLSNMTQIEPIGNWVVALKGDGTVWSWGYNGYGQLGNDSMAENSNVPVQATGLTGVQKVFGEFETAYAIKTNGTVWGWGYNYYGQVGNGTTGFYQRTPVQATGITTATDLHAGLYHVVVKLSDNTLMAWGKNDEGAVGDGTTTNRTTPVPVNGLTDIVKVEAATSSHNLALKSDGTIWAWGRNEAGTIGDGTNIQRNSPVQITTLTNVSDIFSYEHTAFAIKNDGTAWGWGSNGTAMLGDGTYTDSNVPIQIHNLSNVTYLHGDFYNMVALEEDNSAYGWGDTFDPWLGAGNNYGFNSYEPARISGTACSTVIDPVQGSIGGGTAVTITGDNFYDGASVTFDGLPATDVTVVDMGTITATSPAHAAGVVSFSVTNLDGQSETYANGFEYSGVTPTVTDVSPASGPASGGTMVLITGTGFTGATSASFGGSTCNAFSVMDDTSIECETSAHHPGAIIVSVTGPNGTGMGPGLFTYNAGGPAPTGVTATPGNEQITLNWDNMPDATGYNIYRVMGGELPLFVLEDTGGPIVINSYTVTDLPNNMERRYVVTAIYAGGESDYSDPPVRATPTAGGGCVAGLGETCGEITIGCNLGGTISISNITPEATFEPRSTNFYQDPTNAPLESVIQVDITDTRGYGSCGDASTLSIQSSGLALGASTLGLNLGTALTQGSITCPDDNCVPDSAHLSDVATTPGATGSIATGADVLNLSEGFDGTIRLQISGDNLEVVKPLEPISKGDYVGDITFTLI